MPGEIGGKIEQEAEANAFAMELLMPREMLKTAYARVRAETSDLDVLTKRLAATFQVEPKTMHARLLMLGYILG